jgi:hypothetical protein
MRQIKLQHVTSLRTRARVLGPPSRIHLCHTSAHKDPACKEAHSTRSRGCSTHCALSSFFTADTPLQAGKKCTGSLQRLVCLRRRQAQRHTRQDHWGHPPGPANMGSYHMGARRGCAFSVSTTPASSWNLVRKPAHTDQEHPRNALQWLRTNGQAPAPHSRQGKVRNTEGRQEATHP